MRPLAANARDGTINPTPAGPMTPDNARPIAAKPSSSMARAREIAQPSVVGGAVGVGVVGVGVVDVGVVGVGVVGVGVVDVGVVVGVGVVGVAVVGVGVVAHTLTLNGAESSCVHPPVVTAN